MGSVHIRAFQSHHSFWFPEAALKGKTRLSTSLQPGGRSTGVGLLMDSREDRKGDKLARWAEKEPSGPRRGENL